MKKKLLIFLIILSSLPALAGYKEKSPIRWGKITAPEYELAGVPNDPNADAVILCDFGDVEVSHRSFYARHTRIKILKESGLRFATVEIPYLTDDKYDMVFDIKAQTFVMENGKIVIYKVKATDIEDIKINDRWHKKKITLPHVAPGVVIEYNYRIGSLDFQMLDSWYFQHDVPTLWSEVRFKVPPPFVYLMTFEDNRPLAADEEAAFAKRLQWLYDTGERQQKASLVRDNYLLYHTSENRFKVWVLNNQKKKIVMKNLPGLQSVAGNQPVTEFYPQVRFVLYESSGNVPWAFRPLILTTNEDFDEKSMWELLYDPNAISGFVHYRLKTWSQYNAFLLKHDRFGGYLIKGTDITDFPSTAGVTKDADRINAIYQYVRNRYTWDGQFRQLAGQDFAAFERKRIGSSAEINLMLVNLLRRNGIACDPLLIRTSDLGMPEKMYPVHGQFNHVIVKAEVDGKIFLLDATSDSPDLARLNVLDIGTEGWIVSNEKAGWVEIFNLEGKEQPAHQVTMNDL